MTKLTKQRVLMCVIFVSHSSLNFAAEIYRAENPDGTFRYASQPLDASYQLYLKSDVPSGKSENTRLFLIKQVKQSSLDSIIKKHAQQYGVDEALVRAVIEVESNFNALALSSKGAAGAMQLMPATAARYGVTNRHDPSQNIEAGVRYLRDLLTLHNGNVPLALAAYNSGEGTVAKYGMRVPPYKETMLYVPAVLMRMQAASPQ